MIEWIPKQKEITSGPDDVPEMIWRILMGRHITSSQDIQSIVKPSLRNLSDPFSLYNMDLAVSRLMQAYQKNEKICIYGDYDLDGTSGVALLKMGFEDLGFSYQNVLTYQPSRLTEGYGFHKEAINYLIEEQGVQLIVTVDVGITDVESVLWAKQRGMDVIITDHHLPKEKLPDAFAVVNPNQIQCQSNLGYLCGAGVAFYLLMALKKTLSTQRHSCMDVNHQLDLKKFLDFFAVGTVTDLVPLVGDNRILVKHGLMELSKTTRPGFRALLREVGLLGKKLTSSELAIRFAPKINALSRMDSTIRPLDLFLVEDDQQAGEMVKQIMEINSSRVAKQKHAETLALEIVKNNNPQEDGFLWVYSSEFHKGVVGLVATQLSQIHQVPAYVGALDEKQGLITGSVRVPVYESVSVLKALEAVSDGINQFGGHDKAAGFELSFEQESNFLKKLKQFYLTQLKANKQELNQIEYDVECGLNEINEMLMKWLDHLEPYGTKFESPLFLFRFLEVVQIKILNGGHLKFIVGGVNLEKKEAVWFSPPQNHVVANSISRGDQIDLIAFPQWNVYQGVSRIQLTVRDIRFSQTKC